MSNSKSTAVQDNQAGSNVLPARLPSAQSHVGRFIQRRCGCGEKCGCQDGHTKKVQRQAAPGYDDYGYSAYDEDPFGFSYSDPLFDLEYEEGVPLDPETLYFMEDRFQTDFSDVRLHTGPNAEERARALGAEAFTVGNHVYFATSAYAPGMDAGLQLLTHELTHVLQQRVGVAAKPADGSSLEVSTPGDPYEQEADRAASDVAAGRKPTLTLASAPRIQRATSDLKDTDRIVNIKDPFVVPKEKGDATAGAEYSRAIREGRLGTIAKFTRPGTSTLRNTWKQRTGWRGTDKEFVAQFSDGENACEVDHIIELQVGGSNNMENLQILEKRYNGRSGSRINSQVSGTRRRLEAIHGNDVVLRFTKLKIETPVTDDKCLALERNIDATGEEKGTWITLTFGQTTAKLPIPKTTIAPNTYKVKGRYWQVIAGLKFSQITWNPDKSGSLVGEFTSGAVDFLKDKRKKKVTLDIKDGVVNIDADSRVKPLLFPFLSEADLTLSLGETGLSGKGSFTPSVPLLDKTTVHIAIDNGIFSGAVQAKAEEINVPIPGVQITEASIEARLQEQQFSASGALAFDIGQFAKARLEAGADKDGFNAKGTIDFEVPGLDTAQGVIKYEQKRLTGQITLGKDKFKMKGVKSASLVIDIDDESFKGHGVVLLDVPGVKQGTLEFGVKDDKYSITGGVALDIPGLKAADIALTLADGDLSGSAQVGLDIPGLEGAGADFTIKYAKAAITGESRFTYTKGKFTGGIHAKLNEQNRISGGGELSFALAKNLVAKAAVDFRENGTMEVKGGLEAPDDIPLFDLKDVKKNLPGIPSVQFPIFGIPVGTRSIGLVATIGATINASAGVGPGVIRGANISATFDPSQEDWDFSLTGGGELYVPASATLTVGIRGGLGLSVVIASATGFIELTGALGLEGALSAQVGIKYANDQFSVDAKASVFAQPVLTFAISSGVNVDVSLIFTTVTVYEKKWELASVKWGSGLRVGMEFPVTYVFGEDFTLEASQAEFIMPEIDIKQAVMDLLPE